MAEIVRSGKSMKSANSRMKRLAEIESRIQPVTSIDSPLHMLLWGRVKSGKTAFIATGPRPIIFACEEGTKTIRDFPEAQVFPIGKDGRYIPPRWKDARDFIYYLNYADHNYGTVGVDTTTALLRIAVRFINKDEEIRDDLRAPGLTDQRTWGRVTSIMSDFMEDLEAVCKSRGMHLIYTAQERALGEDQALRAGSDFVPDLTPAIRSTILEKPDILARTVKEDAETEDITQTKLRYGMVFAHPEWPVGARLPKSAKPLPSVAYDVTIPKLVKRLGVVNG